MKISVNKDVFAKCNPKLSIACVLVKGIDNKSKIKESKHLLHEAGHLARMTFHKETLKNHNMISPWAVAQETFGKDAKHYHTSVERLLKKVLRGKTVAVRDVLTNLLQYMSLKHILPFGVDDMQKIDGDVTFSVATGREKKGVLRSLKKGELYYHDEKNVLGTKLDFSRSRRTALTPKTTSALVHFDILPPITVKEMREVLKEAEALIRSFCGGSTKVFVLDRKKKTIKV